MTYSEALDWLEQVGRGGSRLGLDRVRAYLTRLGAPQDQIPMIHVAGTNGKGSVSACLSAILTQAGYRVGLYTSPHLDRFNERFRIRGEEISDAAFADLVSQGRAVWETMEDKPTEFEVITALAFLYFAQSACDLVVLEVGLGGRLDATNVIPTPLAAVITKLGLGDDVVAILDKMNLSPIVTLIVVYLLVAVVAGPLSSTATLTAVGVVGHAILVGVGFDPLMTAAALLMISSTEGASPPASGALFVACGLTECDPPKIYMPLINWFVAPIVVMGCLVATGILPVP